MEEGGKGDDKRERRITITRKTDRTWKRLEGKSRTVWIRDK